MLRRAPPELMPVPESDRASAPTEIPPASSKTPPFCTVVPATVVPRALAWAIRSLLLFATVVVPL